MSFTPSSNIFLLDVPINNGYKHQLYFNDATSQYNYFYAQRKQSFVDVTYQRKDNSIKVNQNIDDLWNVNYVMYQNENFTNKWFYAFITRMEYVSDSVTAIFIETDVYQTWRFECEIKKSFVVREHVTLDTIGSSIMDEQLEIGEYLMNDYNSMDKMGDNWNILVTSDNSPLGVFSQRIGNLYGNIVTGCTYLPFPNTTEGIEWLKDTIALYDTAGKPDALVMIFTVPHLLIKDTVDDVGWELGLPITTGSPYGVQQFDLPKKVDNINGYVPKNKKLFTFPYNFFYVSNNLGQSSVFRYEDFTHPTNSNLMRFLVFGSVSPDPVIMLAPCNYKGADGTAFEYGLTMKGFPLGSWQSDTYTAWFAQNVGSVGVTLTGSTLAIVGGALTGNALAVGGGALGIASQMAQLSQAKIQPDQAKGQIGNNSLMYSAGVQDFYCSHMTIKSGFAKKLDDFFTMFGYKVNALKVPEIHTRQRWNYIQTIDVNIDGAIPNDDMEVLKNMYDKGVTLWHNPAEFLNYDLNNTIGSNYNSSPTATYAEIDETGNVITVTFSEAMQTPDSNYWGFTVENNKGYSHYEVKPILSMTHPTPTTFTIALETPIIEPTDIITLSYVKGEVIAEDFGVLASFTNLNVTNTVLPTQGAIITIIGEGDYYQATNSWVYDDYEIYSVDNVLLYTMPPTWNNVIIQGGYISHAYSWDGTRPYTQNQLPFTIRETL